MIVEMRRIAQTPVMMPPIGKIRMWRPGTTKGASEATTSVWMGDCTAVLDTVAAFANTPDTNVASPDARVVFTVSPSGFMPVSVTVGMRSFSS